MSGLEQVIDHLERTLVLDAAETGRTSYRNKVSAYKRDLCGIILKAVRTGEKEEIRAMLEALMKASALGLSMTMAEGGHELFFEEVRTELRSVLQIIATGKKAMGR